MELGRPPSKRPSSEEKPSTILAAALELFAEQGFHATNVPLIAKRAGVSVGTLYHYFPSKEAIANELYRRTRDEMAKAVYRSLPTGVPPAEQFRVLWQRWINYAMTKPIAFRFLETHHHGYLDETSQAVDKRIADRTQERMQFGRLSGVLKPVHDEVLLAFIDGAIKHLVRGAHEGRIELTPAVVDQAAACCWQAIKEGWITMDNLTLAGNSGRVSLAFEYVQSGADGGDCRGTVSIANYGLQAQGKVWLTAAAMTKFRDELNGCYQALNGVAALTAHQETLKLAVVFGHHGRVHIEGTFKDGLAEGNELQFRIHTDQSYIADALEELDQLVKRFGEAV